LVTAAGRAQIKAAHVSTEGYLVKLFASDALIHEVARVIEP
jgi:hypothetical protein